MCIDDLEILDIVIIMLYNFQFLFVIYLATLDVLFYTIFTALATTNSSTLKDLIILILASEIFVSANITSKSSDKLATYISIE